MGELTDGIKTMLAFLLGAIILVQVIIWGAMFLFSVLFDWVPAAGMEIEDY